MYLAGPLNSLLACVLLMLTTQVVESMPLNERSPQFVTLPLKRMEQSRGLHPQIELQQRINKSHRRLARMTGRAGPTDETLVENLQKRVLAIEGPEGLERRFNREGVPQTRRENGLEKRYNRVGVPSASKKQSGSSSLVATLKKKKHGKKSGAGTGAGAGAGAGGAGTGAGTGAGAGGAGSAGSSGSSSQQTPPSDVTEANAPTDSDSLGLDIEAQDEGYLATVQMGTPPRDFLILMDSGSADLWVGAENCQSQGGGGCGNHNFLGNQSSTSFVDSGKPFSVTYGTGQVSGDIVTDNISVANLTLNKHTFGVATTESVDFSSDSTPFDGLMGLAKSTLSEQQTDTPVESLASAGLIPAAITSFKISRLADNLNDGEITFGGLDTSKFDPNTLISIPNVNQDGFWEGAIDAVSVNGADLGLSGRTAILDTGTTLMVVPPADAQTIHNNIQGAASDGQGGFTVPCTTNASVALTFGGQVFDIDPRDIAFTPVNANDPTGDCVSGITSGEIGGADEWLVGDVFLKNAYFSTDEGKNTVSLAKLV